MAPSPTSPVLCSPWATVEDVPQTILDELQPALTDAEVNAQLELASEILWALSGRRWYGGGCTETVTLRSTPPQPGRATWPYHRSWGACSCWRFGVWDGIRLYPVTPDYRGVHLAPPMAVRLPRSPVTAITAVTVNGDPFTDYRLVRAGWLERTDGLGWNGCDDSTEITYEFGEPPPAGGVAAAVDLGTEMAKNLLGLDECQLPMRTVQVSRQGVSMTVVDPAEFLEKGKVGLPTTDLWLAAVNPQATPQAGMVWSPDIPTTLRS